MRAAAGEAVAAAVTASPPARRASSAADTLERVSSSASRLASSSARSRYGLGASLGNCRPPPATSSYLGSCPRSPPWCARRPLPHWRPPAGRGWRSACRGSVSGDARSPAPPAPGAGRRAPRQSLPDQRQRLGGQHGDADGAHRSGVGRTNTSRPSPPPACAPKRRCWPVCPGRTRAPETGGCPSRGCGSCGSPRTADRRRCRRACSRRPAPRPPRRRRRPCRSDLGRVGR